MTVEGRGATKEAAKCQAGLAALDQLKVLEHRQKPANKNQPSSADHIFDCFFDAL